MKKEYLILGMVLVLLALPYFVEGLNSKDATMDNVKVTPVEHVLSASTEGITHHYKDLSTMPEINIETLKTGTICSKESDCGQQEKIEEPMCIGLYKYQRVVQPRCMNDVNASTPPDCKYTLRYVIIGGC